MLSRLSLLWSCLALLCVACSVDASPRTKTKSTNDKVDGGAWQPRGAGTTGRRLNAETEDVADASKPDVQAERDAGDTSPAVSDSGAASPAAPPSGAQDPSAPAPDEPDGPTAGDVAPQPASNVGTGGAAGDQAMGAAGSGGAADGGSEDRRQSLIDAAIEALGGGPSDGGDYPWRNGGGEGEGLNADFVKSVLFSLVASGTCFRDTRRCVQTCFVIASDCKPCSEDPECADALRSVCGPLGTCNSP